MSILEVAPVERVSDAAILLVEDDPGDALLVQASLQEVGVPERAIAWARTLTEALTLLASSRPGCVLLDLGLPDSDGYSGVRDMVSAAPDTAVIVLTGRQERDGAGALSVGAQDYLVKDAITGELLERSIRYAVERKRAQEAQRQLLEVQLSAAEQARLERGLLPSPRLSTDAIAVATYYRPGRDNAVLGGDFYDIVEIGPGHVRAIIGDVMGHGPDEAALGVHLRVAWRAMLFAGVPDDEIMSNLAKLLASEESSHVRYVTACDVTLRGNRLLLRVAGHPAPIIGRHGGAAYPDVRVGPPIGVRFPGGAQWPVTEHALEPGSSVLLYSDGLLEAYQDDPADESLGIDALVAAMADATRSEAPPSSWIAGLVAGAPRESVDDTAAVVLTSRTQG